MKIKKNTSGYTILEVMLAISVALILGSMATMGMRNFMVERSIEKEVVSFWKELCAIRAKVLKYDECYFVTFDTGGKPYQIWKDDGDCVYESDEDTWVPSAFLAKVEYGVPADAQGKPGPDGTTQSSNIEGGWTSAFKVMNDDLGSINTGRVFLYSPRLEEIGYCVQLKALTQNIKLYKWNGSWIEM